MDPLERQLAENAALSALVEQETAARRSSAIQFVRIEPDVTVNGQTLTTEESRAVRLAIFSTIHWYNENVPTERRSFDERYINSWRVRALMQQAETVAAPAQSQSG